MRASCLLLAVCAAHAVAGCSSAEPVTLAPAQASPTALAASGGYVYWASGGAVMVVSTGGGTPMTLATGQFDTSSIAVDSTSVYWTNVGQTDDCTGVGPGGTCKTILGVGTIMKVPVGGGTPMTLAAGQEHPESIAVDGANVYWTNEGPEGAGGGYPNGSVMQMPTGGGAPLTLASGQPWLGGLAVDSGNVYWTASDGVFEIAAGSKTPTILASGQASPTSNVAVSGTHVFWMAEIMNSFASDLLERDFAGGATTTIASPVVPGGWPWIPAVGADATNVYWSDRTSFLKASLDGGTVTTVAIDVTFLSAWPMFVMDDANLYWFDDRGNLLETPKSP